MKSVTWEFDCTALQRKKKKRNSLTEYIRGRVEHVPLTRLRRYKPRDHGALLQELVLHEAANLRVVRFSTVVNQRHDVPHLVIVILEKKSQTKKLMENRIAKTPTKRQSRKLFTSDQIS